MVECNALNARLRAQRSSARAGGTPDSLQDLSGAPPDSQAGPQVRAPTVGTQQPGDVVGAPDVRCARRQQPPPTVKFGGWGYKYPNHPTFKSSKFFTFQPFTRALAFNSRHTQVIKSSPNSTKALVLSERDLLCSFELLRLDCFLSHSFLRSNSLVIEARDTNRVVILVGTLCSK